MSENNGRFKPGQSGNPSGRPKEHAEVKALARAHAPRAIERLAEIMNGEDERAAAAAANALLDRGFGKPAQVIAGDDDLPAVQVAGVLKLVKPEPSDGGKEGE